MYSEADKHAKHVHLADQAFCIGPAAAKDSYLRKDRVLEVSHLKSLYLIRLAPLALIMLKIAQVSVKKHCHKS